MCVCVCVCVFMAMNMSLGAIVWLEGFEDMTSGFDAHYFNIF